MNTTKAHIAALSLLDRALIAITDDELKALLAGLPEDHVSAVRRISGLRPIDGGDTITPVRPDVVAVSKDASTGDDADTTATTSVDATSGDGAPEAAETASAVPAASASPAAGEVDDTVIEAIRLTAHKGRLNGDLQRLGVVLSDACLAECVEKLGDNADMPSEDDLTAVLPGLVENHGVGAVRLMLASTVVGEAPASAVIVGLLKSNEVVKLPALAPKPIAPLLPPKADDAERLRLKALRKERKAQEQAAARLRRDQIARAKSRG